MSSWRPVKHPPKWLAWLPGWSIAPLRWLLRLSLIALVLGGAVAFFYFHQAGKFNLDEVAAIPARTIVLDRDGKELHAGWGASRRLASREDLPDFLVKSLLAREDAKFLSHPGIDVKGLLRATIRNLKDRDFTQGASTLTMQLAKNTYENRAKSIHRKLLEIALTLRIERRYSKDEILTHYLNRIYFGAGCHGIEEAARTYFGKSVSGLHPGECAMLVGIIRGPHIFSPFNDIDAARAQQSEVLDRLVSTGDIDAAERERIAALPIKLVPKEQRVSERTFALQAVRKELNTILDAADIRLDGLVVETTLDSGWQLRLETEITDQLREAESAAGWPHPVHAEHTPGQTPAYLQCAAVTLDFKTGEILAHIGGRDFLDSNFDRATGARRDLGTAFEPWIAAAASERGKRVLPGRPLLTGRQIGPAETARIAKRCGIGGPFLESEDLFRGSAATTPAEAATALATLADHGKRPRRHFIRRVSDSSGITLYQREPKDSQAITRAAADEALSLFDASSGTRCFTGSTGSDRDAWLLRIGPSGATVVWLGFDDPQRITTDSDLDRILNKLVTRLAN